MPEDISAAERMVREWQERASERARKFDEMRAQVEQISVTESSRDGSVRVTVGSNGMLQGLELSESAGNRSMSQLSGEIMRTLQLAQSRIPELMQQAVAGTVGTEDSAAQHVLGEARRNFPEAPEDDEGPRSPGVQEMRIGGVDDERAPRRGSSRRRADEFDDDDFGGGSFLR